MYWRYSANSTLNPLNGLRCSPVRNPSTMVRARSSSVPRRATTAGSRNWRVRAPWATAYIPLFGTATVSSRRSMIVSGVMFSDSA